MTPRQQQIMNIIENYVDSEGNVTISIHELGFPVTPESINPAIADFIALKELGQLSNFERVSSRKFKLTKQL
jgi:hypothetical protein